MHILILRDPRESKAKCSLTPLVGLSGIDFVEYRHQTRVDVGARILLHPEGDLLSEADAGQDLLLIDCSWRRVPRLLANVEGALTRRRLPELTTAYPRKSKTFEDPRSGLASVEALYAATQILGSPRPELLAQYRWRDAFLEANPEFAAPARDSENRTG